MQPDEARARRRPRLLVCGPISDALASVLEMRYDVERYGGPVDLTASHLHSVDVLVIRSPYRLQATSLTLTMQLKVVIRAGSGMDGICTDALTAHGIVLHRLNFAGVSVAEHAFALLLAAARQLPAMTRSIRAQRWEKASARGIELDGKTLLIIGFGQIGRHVARIAQGFRLRVLVTDSSLQKADKREAWELLSDRSAVPLDEGLARADIVILCASLNDRSRNMLNSDALSRLKDGAILVNVARAELIDEIALKAAVATGKLHAVGLDAHYDEPEPDWDFLSRESVVATPHVGAQTIECRARIEQQIVELTEHFADTWE
ncbi:hypothetical protein LJR230_001330 [Trinickia sp. LjRoot230]|uniref:NAD(P)-dependent oxidoreductase n=1 Tax=Trinickia sp. LjRoot230 TaxID=3342288 RepID=UPI003ECDCFC7